MFHTLSELGSVLDLLADKILVLVTLFFIVAVYSDNLLTIFGCLILVMVSSPSRGLWGTNGVQDPKKLVAQNYTSVTLTRSFRMGPFAWDIVLDIFFLGTFAWDISIGNFRLGFFCLGSFAWHILYDFGDDL